MKMDEERDPLPGASFKILDANGYTLQKDLVTDSDGRIWVSNLALGATRLWRLKRLRVIIWTPLR